MRKSKNEDLTLLLDPATSAAQEWKLSGNVSTTGRERLFKARIEDLTLSSSRDALTDGVIDIGVLVVPDDTLARYLTDRGPRFSDAVRHVRAARAEDFPLLVLGLHHDGPGDPLAKQKKRKMDVEE